MLLDLGMGKSDRVHYLSFNELLLRDRENPELR